jgi:SAM-dependent methyltransferase
MTTLSDDEIRATVSKAYSGRARPVLERGEVIPLTLIGGGGACCGPDDESCSIGPAAEATSCCGSDAPGEVQLTNVARMYADANIADLPATVTDVAFGCGNPTAIAALQPGETVLDLGSGGGIDCFLASKMVGPEGRVFGVDMTPDMIALARKNAAKVGAANVEFRLGEIEHLPIADGSIDVVISNCVINLSPDKDQVFREVARVLRPGGRLQVSDIVWTRPAPEDVTQDMEKWAGCIAGALLERDYLAKIAVAGLVDVTSVATEYPDGRGIASASVVAFKPA